MASVATRRKDMKSNHAGNYWVGTFEISQDGPRGIIQSNPPTYSTDPDPAAYRSLISDSAGLEGTVIGAVFE